MLQFLILGTISFILIIYCFMQYKFNHWKRRNIAGPKPLALFGNIINMVLRKENSMDTYKKIYNQFPDEPVVGFYRMTSPCLLIRDLDIVRHVMIKDFDVFEDRGVEFSKEGLGANLFHADGETWRVLRHKFTPIFTTGKLKNMTYLIVEQCDKFMTFLENSVSTEPEQEIYYHLKRYTISTITACAFGLSVNTLSEPLMKTLAEIDKLTLQSSIFHEIDMMFPGLFKRLNLSLFPKRVQNFFEEMVSKIIKERNGKPSQRNDFMDVVLEMIEEGDNSKKHETKKIEADESFQFTNSVIAAQAFVFYVAGYETSATTLSYLLFHLAEHPQIQDKVIEEVDKVLKKYDRQITYDSLHDLCYIEYCFNEVYRKYPVVPLLRRAIVDYKVPDTDIVIEKDTALVFSALGVHNDEKYYYKPELFDPDRFNPENSKDRHPCAFLPFGVGPRNCIGKRFAQLQSRVCLLKILSKFRVEPSSLTTKIEYDPYRIIGSPIGGVYLKLIPRV